MDPSRKVEPTSPDELSESESAIALPELSVAFTYAHEPLSEDCPSEGDEFVIRAPIIEGIVSLRPNPWCPFCEVDAYLLDTQIVSNENATHRQPPEL